MSRLSTKQRNSRRRNGVGQKVFQGFRQVDVAWWARDYEKLLEAQRAAPDWPYEGQSYVSSNSAQEARDDWWIELERYYGRGFHDAVYAYLYGGAS